MSRNEYIIEFYQVANNLKVTAIDGATGLEASVIVPLNTAREDAKTLAVRKLEYVLNKHPDKT